ncbi:MAG TPA: FAD-dependent oxidoreductase, partial [Candidatus Saccharimonadales bacterium]|nr:FAD-dependent oxidoreductase [Candidatus Saccharimonadales bacterium]
AKVAAGLGLPASFETQTDLPFSITAAVKFSGQGHFSAQKYLEDLAKKLNGNDSHVYENTKAIGFTGGVVKTAGGKVTAKNIIIATNVPTFPLLARGAYCALEYPTNSYLIAGRANIKLRDMYISPDSNHYSLLPVGDDKDQILLVGGGNHIPGLGRAKPSQQKLADYAQKHFGMKEVKYRWHARDYLAYDGVPLIGKLYPWSRHIYVATAFKKWGLSHSMVAGILLRDQILGENNPWAELYSPQRLSPLLSIPLAMTGKVVR